MANFVFNQDVKENSNEGTGSKFITVDADSFLNIRKLQDIEYIDSEDGQNDYILVTVTDDNGKIAYRRYRVPVIEKAKSQESFDKACEIFYGVLSNIFLRFIPTVKIESDDLKDAAKQVINAIKKSKYDRVNVWSKVIYDEKGYVTLPQYAPLFHDTIDKDGKPVSREEALKKLYLKKGELTTRPAYTKKETPKPDDDIFAPITEESNISDIPFI